MQNIADFQSVFIYLVIFRELFYWVLFLDINGTEKVP